MIDVTQVRRGQFCQVRLQVDGVLAGGLVLRVPGGPRVLLKPEFLELATPADEQKPAKKRKKD